MFSNVRVLDSRGGRRDSSNVIMSFRALNWWCTALESLRRTWRKRKGEHRWETSWTERKEQRRQKIEYSTFLHVPHSTFVTPRTTPRTTPNGRPLLFTTWSQSKTMVSAGAVDWLDCTPGKYQDEVKSTICKDCDAGQHQKNDGTQACVSCDGGKTMSTTGAVDCLDCTPGKYQDEVKSTICKDCDAAPRIG